jgi:hypothetical protein
VKEENGRRKRCLREDKDFTLKAHVAFLYVKHVLPHFFKAGIVKPEETAIARQPTCKHAIITAQRLRKERSQKWRKCWKRSLL